MKQINEFFTSKYIYVPIILWISIQSFKVLCDLVKYKKFNFKRIFGAGGMPSTHSAVVMSLTTLIGKNLGIGSPEFAMAFIFSCVVMYDAAGVRRAAGKQARILNKIIETPGMTNVQVQEKLVEFLGHTPIEVLVGAIIGILAGLLL